MSQDENVYIIMYQKQIQYSFKEELHLKLKLSIFVRYLKIINTFSTSINILKQLKYGTSISVGHVSLEFLVKMYKILF